MSTGDRCSRCSDCSCSRCSENGTGDSESPKSSLFCTCIGQPATATPATAATPRKGQRPALQTIVTQPGCRAAQAMLTLWLMQGWHPVPASGSRSQKTPHEAGCCIDVSCTSVRGGRSADAQELPASVKLTTDVIRVPAVGRCSGLRFLERSGRVRIEPRPHSSARPANLRTLDPVAFFLLDLGRLACCGHLLTLHRCRALLPAEAHLVTIFMNRQGNPFARDASSDTSAAGIHSLGVGRCRLLHVVLLCVVDDNAITGCVSENRQPICHAVGG